jgi:hypothetical protein
LGLCGGQTAAEYYTHTQWRQCNPPITAQQHTHKSQQETKLPQNQKENQMTDRLNHPPLLRNGIRWRFSIKKFNFQIDDG